MPDGMIRFRRSIFLCRDRKQQVKRQTNLSLQDKALKIWYKYCRHFSTLDNIQKSVTDELKGIPAEAFRHCYEQWKQRLRRCVAAQGNYFEGDNLDL
jgi:hypothetical protein